MTRYLISSLTLCALIAACLPAVGADDDSGTISVAEYQRFLDSINEDIEVKVNAEFGDEERELDELSHPFKLGTKVTIRYWRGNKLETHTGTLVEVRDSGRPPMVRIGDRDIPFGDIYKIDQERLSWANKGNQGALTVRLQQQRKQLEDRKERMREIERRKRLTGTVYGQNFEEKYIAIGGYYRRRADLGDQTMELVVTVDDHNPMVFCSLVNRTGKPSLVTVYLDRVPVATNVPADMGVQVPNLDWKSYSWWMFSKDLGNGSPDTLASSLGKRVIVHVLQRDVGSWFLVADPNPAAQPRRARSHRAICPECFGTGKVEGAPGSPATDLPSLTPGPDDQPAPPPRKSAAGGIDLPDVNGSSRNASADDIDSALDNVAGQLASQRQTTGKTLVTCPMCLGERQIEDDEEHLQVRAVYRLSLWAEKDKVNDYSADIANAFFGSTKQIAEYQEKVDKEIGSIESAARQKRLGNAEAIKAKQEEAARRAAAQRDAASSAATIEALYDWKTPQEARQLADPSQTISRGRGSFRFDDDNFPRIISSPRGQAYILERLTLWKDPAKLFQLRSTQPRYQLFSLRYRVMKTRVQANDATQYFVQYAVDVDTTSLFDQLELDVMAKVSLKDGTVIDAKEHASLLPTRVTTFIGMVPVSPKDIGNGVVDLGLTATVTKNK